MLLYAITRRYAMSATSADAICRYSAAPYFCAIYATPRHARSSAVIYYFALMSRVPPFSMPFHFSPLFHYFERHITPIIVTRHFTPPLPLCRAAIIAITPLRDAAIDAYAEIIYASRQRRRRRRLLLR